MRTQQARVFAVLVIFVLNPRIRSALCDEAKSPSSRTRIDLSFLPNISPAKVADFLREQKNELGDEVEIDISSSEVGDHGLIQILDAVQTESTLFLTSQTNRLTQKGVARLFDKLSAKSTPKDTVVSEADTRESVPSWKLKSLDLSWNNLHSEGKSARAFLASLRKLVEDPSRCPSILRLDCCNLSAAACRAIGKGIINRMSKVKVEDGGTVQSPCLHLYLCGNVHLGDSAAAALAAAIQMAPPGFVVFETLDLSRCSIGDAGVEAIALAIENKPGSVVNLDLSSNRLTNTGAKALAAMIRRTQIDSLNLSNNEGIADVGAAAIASAMETGKLTSLSICSCSIYADGAEAFGMLVKSLSGSEQSIEIDCSGNPIGTLRKKKKQNAASKLKSKASATTASYMNFIGKKIKSGLKDVGLGDALGGIITSSESDDDEEERMGEAKEDPADIDPAKARCGAKAFASAVVIAESEEDVGHVAPKQRTSCRIGLRRCFLDEGAAAALSATLVQARDRLNIDLDFDVSLNPALEERVIDALHGKNSHFLDDMCERHMRELEMLKASEARAHSAAMSVASQNDYHDFDDEDGGGDFFEESDDGWDFDESNQDDTRLQTEF